MGTKALCAAKKPVDFWTIRPLRRPTPESRCRPQTLHHNSVPLFQKVKWSDREPHVAQVPVLGQYGFRHEDRQASPRF